MGSIIQFLPRGRAVSVDCTALVYAGDAEVREAAYRSATREGATSAVRALLLAAHGLVQASAGATGPIDGAGGITADAVRHRALLLLEIAEEILAAGPQ